MKLCIEDELFADITTLVDGKDFQLHHLILSAQRFFFCTMFTSNRGTPRSPSLISTLVRAHPSCWCTTSTTGQKLQIKDLQEAYKVADIYQLTTLFMKFSCLLVRALQMTPRWDPALIVPLCITSILVSSVTLEVFYLILTNPGVTQIPLLLLASFLVINVVGNMVKFVQSNPTIKGVFLEHDSVGQGWEYCFTCQAHVPPRCNHCHSCNVCVLRRDHHCTLLGKCVGFTNYRYFICSLFHGWIALLLTTILNAEIFINLLNEGISFHSFFLLFMPWMMLLTGQVTASTFIFAFVADTCIGGFLFCLAFLILHCVLLCRGSTTKEWFGGRARDYDQGWKRNAVNFLGERWYLVWLFPWVQSRLPGDGISFEMRNPSAPVQATKSKQ
ncbi:probable palmitoyltransferase ZDHHC24 [Hyperolius riggenbachi]|uniref:probable palmitoyltransferase ZDHHC24 n=1 Tax=Hyperolius riggenbachi TaxID=752182 RepID=UPI0035A3C14B